MSQDGRQSLELERDMNDENYECFISGLRLAIKKAGYKYEKDFAEGIMNPVTLSKNLNMKFRMGDENIQKCAKKLNMDVAEIVLLGKHAELDDDDTEKPVIGLERRDPISSLTQLITTFRKQEENIFFWKACLEGIPIPICIVDSNNTVVFQNQADRSLYKMNVVGEVLCPACRENCDIPHPCDDCAINKVLQVGEPAEKQFSIKEKHYRLIANPIKSTRGNFVVVVTMEIAPNRT